ncbi:LytTR family DNA-binding domain-containing protein [uncultured Dubosiella sp.]|uniref:LytR/AlgR family response regulator transcription factor n=2 Tax=uncultured Dubosiella sp. TaxID=1937011 RepID=UPI0025930524|nr:LytTR family DNA-binding domain-containing protein [uncultured Dubosiella sp.]
MIRVAILEYEKESKEIIFQFGKIFRHTDWMFRHFWKASELAKAMKEEGYQIFVFDEMFKTPRLESVFVHDNPNALFVYVCEDPDAVRGSDGRERMLYVRKETLVKDLEDLSSTIQKQSRQSEVYALAYNGVHVNLPYETIYYLEKEEKMVIFHTTKGEFQKRINMSDLESEFAPYGFLRVHVSYLVNAKHIASWHKDEVELVNAARIPLSRAQKKKILHARKDKG